MKREDNILYPELSYKISGLAFEVFKALGGEVKEIYYSNAFEELLKRDGIKYSRELYYPLKINGKIIGRNIFDFLIEDKVVVEVKRGYRNYYAACDQLFNYLKSSNLKLGIIIRFEKDGARIKRIPNLY
jgi:GxxExxY protein